MTSDVKMLPLPPLPENASDERGEEWIEPQIEAYATDYARANMEPLIAEIERLAEALRELVVDMERAQDNMRNSAKTDPRWEGCAEAIKPRVDAARAALDQEGEK